MKTETTSNKTKKSKVVVSWTGGKDGCFACYKAISEGNFDVAHLLNFRDMKRSGSQEINPELLSAQSQAIGIPILHMLSAQSQAIGIPILHIDFMSYEEEFNLVNITHSLLMDLCSKTG
jgi:diphthamide synthase (EF-2-diphthine--ammonia ligase)